MSSQIDQIIDTLAFGVAPPPKGPCLGLYLSPDTIYIAETQVAKSGALVVNHLLRIPIPAGGKPAAGTMSMNTEFLADPVKIATLIRESMSQIRWSSKNVVVTLSHHLGLLRYFPMPQMESRFLKTSVPLEARKYIPIPFDTLVHDFQAAPMSLDSSKKSRLGVLIAVTQNKNLSNIAALLGPLGLTMIGLEVAPCSVMRLWQAVSSASSQETFVQVHFDGGNVRIMICDKGLPVFFHEVFLGSTATLADQRKIDIPGCLTFAQKQLGLGNLSKIRLSGVAESLVPWKEAFAKETGLLTEIQDTAKLLSIKGGDWGGYAAIGASARSIVPSRLTIDLATIDRVDEDERKAARVVTIIGAGLAALIAGAGLFQSTTYSVRAKELNRYRLDPEIKNALQGMDRAQIDTMLTEMKEQLIRLRAVTGGDRPSLSNVIRDIVDLMPENMWLTSMDVSYPIDSGRGALHIALTGSVRGATAADEQTAAFRFKEDLIAHPKLGTIFNVQIEVTGRPGTSTEGSSGLAPTELASVLEKRTKFSIDLMGKQ